MKTILLWALTFFVSAHFCETSLGQAKKTAASDSSASAKEMGQLLVDTTRAATVEIVKSLNLPGSAANQIVYDAVRDAAKKVMADKAADASAFSSQAEAGRWFGDFEDGVQTALKAMKGPLSASEIDRLAGEIRTEREAALKKAGAVLGSKTAPAKLSDGLAARPAIPVNREAGAVAVSKPKATELVAQLRDLVSQAESNGKLQEDDLTFERWRTRVEGFLEQSADRTALGLFRNATSQYSESSRVGRLGGGLGCLDALILLAGGVPSSQEELAAQLQQFVSEADKNPKAQADWLVFHRWRQRVVAFLEIAFKREVAGQFSGASSQYNETSQAARLGGGLGCLEGMILSGRRSALPTREELAAQLREFIAEGERNPKLQEDGQLFARWRSRVQSYLEYAINRDAGGKFNSATSGYLSTSVKARLGGGLGSLDALVETTARSTLKADVATNSSGPTGTESAAPRPQSATGVQGGTAKGDSAASLVVPSATIPALRSTSLGTDGAFKHSPEKSGTPPSKNLTLSRPPGINAGQSVQFNADGQAGFIMSPSGEREIAIDGCGSSNITIQVRDRNAPVTYAGLDFAEDCVVALQPDGTILADRAGVSATDRNGNQWRSGISATAHAGGPTFFPVGGPYKWRSATRGGFVIDTPGSKGISISPGLRYAGLVFESKATFEILNDGTVTVDQPGLVGSDIHGNAWVSQPVRLEGRQLFGFFPQPSSSAPAPARTVPAPAATFDLPPKDWPLFAGELAGSLEVRVQNPNDFKVRVGLRSFAQGRDFVVGANATESVRVPNGRYEIFFQYSSDPEGLYQGDSFTLDNNGVEIRIVKVVNGNYGIRKVK